MSGMRDGPRDNARASAYVRNATWIGCVGSSEREGMWMCHNDFVAMGCCDGCSICCRTVEFRWVSLDQFIASRGRTRARMLKARCIARMSVILSDSSASDWRNHT